MEKSVAVINLTCQKHPQSNVEFFTYNQQTLQSNLICSRCVSLCQKNQFVIHINDALSKEEKIIPNWPPLKDSALQLSFLESLNNSNQDTARKEITQILQKVRNQFETVLQDLEKKMIKQLDPNNNTIIINEFCKNYQKISQVSALQNYLKQEISKNQKFEDISNDFQTFLSTISKNNSMESELRKAKEQAERAVLNSQLQEIYRFEESVEIFVNQHKDLPNLINRLGDSEKLVKRLQKQIQELKDNPKHKSEEQDVTFFEVAKEDATENRMYKPKPVKQPATQPIQQLQQNPIQYQQQQPYPTQLNQQQLLLQKQSQQSPSSDIDYYKFFQSQVEKQTLFQSHQHKLTFTFSKSFNKVCNSCSKSINFFSWNCKSCSFDTCLSCSSLEPTFRVFYESLLSSLYTYKSDMHAHQLLFIRVKDNNERECDECDRYIADYCWNCSDCEYDLCLNCTSIFNKASILKISSQK